MSAATLPRSEGQPGQGPLTGVSRAGRAVGRHLYVHLPFCAHRCGYCDFVTAVGRRAEHAGYVDALLAELELERDCLAPELETVYLGGGTPTFTEPAELERLLRRAPAGGGGHGRGQPGDRDAGARARSCASAGDPGLPRRPELRAAVCCAVLERRADAG